MYFLDDMPSQTLKFLEDKGVTIVTIIAVPLLSWLSYVLSAFIDPKRDPPPRKVFWAGIVLSIVNSLIFLFALGFPSELPSWMAFLLIPLGWSGGYIMQVIAEEGAKGLRNMVRNIVNRGE